MLLTDPGSDYFKNISVFQDPLRQSAEPWCFSLMLSVPHRVGVGGLGELQEPPQFRFSYLQLQDTAQNKTQLATPCIAATPCKVTCVALRLLSGHHVWNNFYHTSHQMFSHFSNGHFYQERKLPHVAWKLISLKRTAARGFVVPLRTRSSLKGFPVYLSRFQGNEHPDKPAMVTCV